MTIDPSINNLGYAVYYKKVLRHYELLRPDALARDEGAYHLKTLSMVKALFRLFEEYRLNYVVLEMPEHWAIAGFHARESGSMTKLVFLCGGIYHFFRMQGIDIHMLAPREWKGQLPKEVVRERLKPNMIPEYFTEKEWMKLDHNVMDAVAIGQFWINGRV